MLGNLAMETGNFSRALCACSRAFLDGVMAPWRHDEPPFCVPRSVPHHERLTTMTAVLMDTMPRSSSFSSRGANSRFATCLRRFAEAGFRLIVTTPSDARIFARGLERFPSRQIDPAAHAQWETAYRLFSGRGRLPCDRGSWRLLAVDSDDRVVGAISARLFCGEFAPEYLHLATLLETTGPVFREHCDLAMAEVVAAGARLGRTPAEVSGWAVAPIAEAALVAVTLLRGMAALFAAFEDPLVVVATDHRRGEGTRLLRRGAGHLGLSGRFALPPFVHHGSGAWLRLLLVDTPTYFARSGVVADADLALLREQADFVSTA